MAPDYHRHVQDAVIDLLLEAGAVSREEVDQAIEHTATAPHPSVLYQLRARGIVRPEVVEEMLAEHFGVPVSKNLADRHLEDRITSIVDAETALDKEVIPLSRTSRELVIAMANPTDQSTISTLEFATGLAVRVEVADTYSIRVAMERHYSRTSELLEKALDSVDPSISVVSEEEEEEIAEAIQEGPVVRLLEATMADAVRQGASDIHIEPLTKDRLRIRFRVDGVLRNVGETRMTLHDAIVARTKHLSKTMKLQETRSPQDGAIRMKVDGRVIDFRVNTMPTSLGEKAVIRILDQGSVKLDLEALGFEGRNLELIDQQLMSPTGMVIATGPTGAGKTTTLYSMLARLDRSKLNVVSAEDPIEYDLVGVNQTQVRPDVGFTFADALRAMLRQDPDVILVGEMRDLLTVETAMQAAFTGHLVLSTLHTRDSAGAFTRLINMGAERFNLVSSINLVIAQRLLPRICPRCSTEVHFEPERLAWLGLDPELSGHTFRKGVGCVECDGSGILGRLGIYEVLQKDEEMDALIMDPTQTAQDIRRHAVKKGMTTLLDAGVERAVEGTVSLEDVIRITRSH